MADDLMTIRQMCEEYDVTPRTLRFYESKELLSPLREGQRRLYSNRDRARLTLILKGKRFGFSLEEIRQLLSIYGEDGGGLEAQQRRAYEIGKNRLSQMEHERAHLEAAMAELREQLDWCKDKLARYDMATAAAE